MDNFNRLRFKRLFWAIFPQSVRTAQTAMTGREDSIIRRGKPRRNRGNHGPPLPYHNLSHKPLSLHDDN
jgi:hypothetical protein